MFLEYSRCSVAGDDADRDPAHDDGTDAVDAQVHVDVDADAGDEVENHDSDDMRVVCCLLLSLCLSFCQSVCLFSGLSAFKRSSY